MRSARKLPTTSGMMAPATESVEITPEARKLSTILIFAPRHRRWSNANLGANGTEWCTSLAGMWSKSARAATSRIVSQWRAFPSLVHRSFFTRLKLDAFLAGIPSAKVHIGNGAFRFLEESV